MLKGAPGRLFWKLLLALCASMLLSIVAAVAYLQAVDGSAPPGGAPRAGMLSLVPLAPVITGMVAMLVVGVAVAWSLALPLRQLRRGLDHVAQGHFDVRVAPALGGRRDELADLAQDFDRMAAQLQQLRQARQVLLHDISHEMRSPLARMQAAIGLLRQDASQTAAMVDRIERESQRMDALVEELLIFHRLEAAPETWAVGTVDVLDLLHAVAEDADFEARAVGRELHIAATGQFIASVRGELLHRAFENIVRNAVKYTAPSTVVEVQAQMDDGALVVTVGDRGPGVPEDARELMFQPFTRLEGAASVRGVGLGLAIARRALEVHGGTIVASNRPDGGLLMTVRLNPSSVALT